MKAAPAVAEPKAMKAMKGEEEGSHEGGSGSCRAQGHEGNEGDEEEGSHEGGSGSCRAQGHEGHEGDEEEGGDEGNEGHEGHEEVNALSQGSHLHKGCT